MTYFSTWSDRRRVSLGSLPIGAIAKHVLGDVGLPSSSLFRLGLPRLVDGRCESVTPPTLRPRTWLRKRSATWASEPRTAVVSRLPHLSVSSRLSSQHALPNVVNVAGTEE